MEPTIRQLTSEDWPEAARLVGRAIFDEPYMRVAFGEDRVSRFVRVSGFFGGFDGARAERLVVGVYLDGLMVAMAGATEPGGCRHCLPPEPSEADEDDPWDIAFREVDPKARAAHQGLPPHWYVAPVASEPAVQGAGFGRAAMVALVEAAMLREPAAMTLDCLPSLAPFYERFGFEVLADVSGGRIDMVAMLRPQDP